jgi:hypothetical protein
LLAEAIATTIKRYLEHIGEIGDALPTEMLQKSLFA